MIIYVEQINPRIEYIFDFIFSDLLGLDYQLSNHWDSFKNSTHRKLIYASRNPGLKDALFLKAEPLLFESDVKFVQPAVFPYRDTKAFFKIPDNQSFFAFDVFAASFYLLSRYEEYLAYKPDKFGRFPAKESIAVKNDFIEQPVINIWAEYLKATLLKHYPDLKFKQNKFRFIPTIDIDNAYAYLHKGFVRSVLSSVKLLLQFKINDFFEKQAVHLNLKKDPYDSYGFLLNIHKEKGLNPLFFFLTAGYARYDKNISPKGKAFKKLVKNIAATFKIGIHPSFASNKNPVRVKKEKEILENIAGKKIYCSRQHFLMLKLPDTYENLIKAGIETDYSMGFAETAGFRAGTCTPFYFFNLKNNRKEKLKIVPFAVMDVGLKVYQGLNAYESEEKIKKIIQNVKKVKGLFVSLWHNESLGSSKQWKDWQTVYKTMIEFAQSGNENQILKTRRN